MCNCIGFNAMQCAAQRHDASLTLIACLDAACRCHCHKTANGGPIPGNRWRPLPEHAPTLPVKSETSMKPAIPYGKPRQPPGAKLSAEQVAEIRAIGTSLSQATIARRYNVNQRTIGRILRGERYASVESEEQPA